MNAAPHTLKFFVGFGHSVYKKEKQCKFGPGARFSKVPKLYGPFSGVTIPLLSQERRGFKSSQSVCFLLPWKHVKRSAFQNKRLPVLQTAFRARKGFGTFEKRALDAKKHTTTPNIDVKTSVFKTFPRFLCHRFYLSILTLEHFPQFSTTLCYGFKGLWFFKSLHFGNRFLKSLFLSAM